MGIDLLDLPLKMQVTDLPKTGLTLGALFL